MDRGVHFFQKHVSGRGSPLFRFLPPWANAPGPLITQFEDRVFKSGHVKSPLFSSRGVHFFGTPPRYPLPTHGLIIYMGGGASQYLPDNNFFHFGTFDFDQNEKWSRSLTMLLTLASLGTTHFFVYPEKSTRPFFIEWPSLYTCRKG